MKDFSGQDELAKLIQKELDGSLTSEEFVHFQSLLRKTPDAAAYYVKTILTIAEFSSPSALPFIEQKSFPQKADMLDDAVWEALAEDEVTAPGIQIPQITPPPEFVQPVTYEKVLGSFKKSAIITILINIAAMILLVSFVYFAPVRGKSFAYVMEEHQAEIEGRGASFQVNHFLDDKPFKLVKGLLKIQMNDGSVVLLEAPTEIRLENDDQLFLIQGRLTANVPKEAIGFTVRTPSASIIDYGTEFGVTVDRYAATEAHVLKGNVKIGLGSDPRVLEQTIRLSENQAGRVSGQALHEIPVDLSRFIYNMPSPFELTAKSLGASMYLQFQGDNVSSLKDIVRPSAADMEVNPTLSVVPGPFLGKGKQSYALRIHGPDSAIMINDTRQIPQSRDGSFSIGYWVRFDTIRKQVVSANRIDTMQGSHFRSVSMTEDGYLQHLAHRTTTSAGWRIVTSQEALQPGKWYFVMITRGVTGDNTKNMYVNGKCVSASITENELTELDSFDSFQFGGDIGDCSGFEGELAEILMFPKVLDEKDVRLLYESSMNNP